VSRDALVATSSRDLVAWRPHVVDEAVASVRLRCLRPLRELQKRGFPVELFDPARAGRYAGVVYAKAYDDDARAEAQRLARAGARILVDLCDNHFYFEQPERKLDLKAQLLREMVALADRVVASTVELARVVREQAGAGKPVTVIEDAVESELVAPSRPLLPRLRAQLELRRLRSRLRAARAQGRTPLVWFGLHGGPYARCGIADLERVRDLLHELDRRHPLSLTVISNSRRRFDEVVRGWSIERHYVEWHASTCFGAMREHAIAILPITPSPFTRCKSHNRPAQALALGLAVVADPIPSYEPLRGVIRLGDWERGLSEYLADPAARARDVAAGRELVMQRWSIGRIAAEWEQLLAPLLDRTGAASVPVAESLGLDGTIRAGDAHYRAYVGPPEDFDLVAAMSFNLLTCLGLRQHHRLLDVGCGSLRLGRLFIPYLNAGNYVGIEPNGWLVEEGVRREVGADLVRVKKPRFLLAADGSALDGEERFDFAVAQSIFSHAGRDLVERWLADVSAHLGERGALAATFLIGADPPLEGWLYPSCVRHPVAAMEAAARAAGLRFQLLDWAHPRQQWALFHKPGFDTSWFSTTPLGWNTYLRARPPPT